MAVEKVHISWGCNDINVIAGLQTVMAFHPDTQFGRILITSRGDLDTHVIRNAVPQHVGIRVLHL